MCGIAGQYWFNREAHETTVERVQLMVANLQHRGPDAEGVQVFGTTTFGHARLKIVDLSDSANQPMQDELYMLVFNGEIYNYKELRNELATNYNFRTNSDTEVIIAAYRAWGVSAFNRFNGDWALAILEKRSGRLVLSRDRYGVKPLYYHVNNEVLTFASEVGAIASAGIAPEVAREELLFSLRLRKNEFYSRTLASNIAVVAPGSCIIFDRDKSGRVHPYYDDKALVPTAQLASSADLVECFDELFVDAVSLRYRSDVPVGVCLSGGLDSTCIVAAAKRAGKEVVSFSAGFPDSSADESEYFLAVTEHFGNQAIVRTEYPGADLLDHFEALVMMQDAPQASLDTLGRYFVLEEASRTVTVVLDGQGGDEIFGGYGACFDIYRGMAEARGWVPLEMDLFNRNVEKGGQNAAFNQWFDVPSISPAIRATFSHRPSFMPDAYSQKQYELLRNNLLSLLHTEDRLTMGRSMEGRVPMLDHRLAEFCFSLPVDKKMGPLDKMLMRNWARQYGNVPEKIVTRKDKKGFSTPFRGFFDIKKNRINLTQRILDSVRPVQHILSLEVMKRDLDAWNSGEIRNPDPILFFYSLLLILNKWQARVI